MTLDVNKDVDEPTEEAKKISDEGDITTLTARASRYLPVNVSLGVLAIIASVAALYLARAFFVPLFIGVLASYTLNPVVRWLKKFHIPRPLGAALVLITLVGGVTWAIVSLSDDAATMIEKLPEVTRKIRQSMIDTRSGPTVLQNMLEAAKQLEDATDVARTKSESRAIVIKERAWLHDYALAQSAVLFEVLVQAPIVLLLTFFLLASGSHFRFKLLDLVGPSRARKAVYILDEVTVQIQRFMLTLLLSNVLVGVGIWLVFEILGMEQPGVWGVVAGVLHSVPYLGPATVAIASGMAAFLQFGSLLHALAVTGVSLLVAGAVGFIFMPWLQSRFAGVNATVLFIALLFFAWLWGTWGLLLGGPLVAIVKVICDKIESLKPIGELLGR